MNKDRILLDDILNCNRFVYEMMLNRLANIVDVEDKIEEIKKISKYLIDNPCGVYYSKDLELELVNISSGIFSDLCTGYYESSVLHVMTQAYSTGGHTRVVERWIQQSKMKKTSLLFTESQDLKIISALKEIVENIGGEVISFDDDITYIEKAKDLRKIASEYQYIVLHVHQYDPVPILAFGTNDFKRPVYLFNHADHTFWLGVLIADKVINFRRWGEEICLSKRQINKCVNFGIPYDDLSSFENPQRELKDKNRKRLRLPLDKKIIISVGSAYKYKPFLDINFADYVRKIITYDDVIVVLIGPTFKHLPDIKKITAENKDRLICLGIQSPQMVKKYLMASDLYIDSFPVGGGTICIDAARLGLPSLSLNNPFGLMDFTVKSKTFCNSIDDLLSKSLDLLNNVDSRLENITSTQRILTVDSPMMNLGNVEKEIFSINDHKVYFTEVVDRHFDDLDRANANGFIPRLSKVKLFVNLIKVISTILTEMLKSNTQTNNIRFHLMKSVLSIVKKM